MCCHLIYSDSCFLQLQSPDATPSMRVAALRTMSYALKTLGEVKDSIHYLLFAHFIKRMIICLFYLLSLVGDSMQPDFL